MLKTWKMYLRNKDKKEEMKKKMVSYRNLKILSKFFSYWKSQKRKMHIEKVNFN